MAAQMHDLVEVLGSMGKLHQTWRAFVESMALNPRAGGWALAPLHKKMRGVSAAKSYDAN